MEEIRSEMTEFNRIKLESVKKINMLLVEEEFDMSQVMKCNQDLIAAYLNQKEDILQNLLAAIE